MQASNYSPKDIFWGGLGGCLEMLVAGTTTIVDVAHPNMVCIRLEGAGLSTAEYVNT